MEEHAVTQPSMTERFCSESTTSIPSSSGSHNYHSCHGKFEDLNVPHDSDGSMAMVPSRKPSSPSIPYSLTIPSTMIQKISLQEQALFFGAGLGSSICYVATLSSLVHYKLLFGADSFVYLNLAVYLPLLPISLAQARWDRHWDKKFSSRRAFLVRGIVGFVLGIVGTILMIQGHDDPRSGLASVVLCAGLQGTGGAILYGTLNQLASFVGDSHHSANLKATVAAGIQLSAFVVLVVSFQTGFGMHKSVKYCSFLKRITVIESVCFAMFIYLLVKVHTVEAAMIRRDSSLLLDEETSDDDSLESTPILVASQQKIASIHQLSYRELLPKTWSCCTVLLTTLVPSFLVGSWFTKVHTNWMALASCLFYVRIACDFLGRLATIVVPPRSVSCLMHTSLLRLIPVALFFFNAQQISPLANGLSILLVAIISFLSGYLVTASFQLAPFGLNSEIRPDNVATQASFLTVAFAISAICGLMSSFLLIALGV